MDHSCLDEGGLIPSHLDAEAGLVPEPKQDGYDQCNDSEEDLWATVVSHPPGPSLARQERQPGEASRQSPQAFAACSPSLGSTASMIADDHVTEEDRCCN